MSSSDVRGSAKPVWLTVALCLMVATLEGVDLQAAGVAAPKLGPEFHLSPEQLSWFFSASTIGLFFGAVAGGRLADRFGRKLVLCTAVALFGVFSIANALAPNSSLLILTRVLTGVGLGGALPNLIALTAENAPANRRNAAVSVMYCGMPLGGAVASAISLAGGGEHWRVIFFAGGLAPLAAVPLLALFLPESREFRKVQAADGADTPRPGLVAVLFAEHRALATVLLWTSFFSTLLVLYLLLNWLPTLLVHRGFSRPQASLLQIVFNLGGVAAGVATGLLMDTGLRRMTTIVAYAALGLFLALLGLYQPSLAVEALIGCGLGAGVISTQALLYATAPSCYDTAIRGAGVGAAVAVGRLGSIAGPLLGGVLIGAGRPSSQVLLGILPLVLIGALTALPLVLRRGALVLAGATLH